MKEADKGKANAIIPADKRQLQRQPDESEQAHAARIAYCQLDPGKRSIVAAYRTRGERRFRCSGSAGDQAILGLQGIPQLAAPPKSNPSDSREHETTVCGKGHRGERHC